MLERLSRLRVRVPAGRGSGQEDFKGVERRGNVRLSGLVRVRVLQLVLVLLLVGLVLSRMLEVIISGQRGREC